MLQNKTESLIFVNNYEKYDIENYKVNLLDENVLQNTSNENNIETKLFPICVLCFHVRHWKNSMLF